MKSYSPIHIMVETDLLKEFDSYKEPYKSRSDMVREAIRDYIVKLESNTKK